MRTVEIVLEVSEPGTIHSKEFLFRKASSASKLIKAALVR